jgi:hypothetical protein
MAVAAEFSAGVTCKIFGQWDVPVEALAALGGLSSVEYEPREGQELAAPLAMSGPRIRT